VRNTLQCSWCYVVFFVSFAAEEAAVTHGKIIPGCAFLLIVARAVDGLGTGIVVHFSLVSLTSMFSDEERVARAVDNSFAVLLGLGLGPLLASALVSCCAASGRLCTIGIAYVGVTVAVFLICQVHFPKSLEQIEHYELTYSQQRVLPEKTYSRAALLCSGLACSCTRGFAISGLESGIAFLLQSHYDFDEEHIGLIIGVCFLILLPLRSIYGCIKQMGCMSHMGWTRAFILMTACGSFLLYTGSADLFGIKHSWCLVLACGIMCPFYVMSDAIVTGVMMQQVFPTGSWFDANYLMLWRSICLSAIGRTLGPPLARYSAEFSQDAFATQQVVAVAMVWLLFEAIFRPCEATVSEADMDLEIDDVTTLVRMVSPQISNPL